MLRAVFLKSHLEVGHPQKNKNVLPRKITPYKNVAMVALGKNTEKKNIWLITAMI